MIVAVSGMARESRLIAHPRVVPVVGGGDIDALESRIDAAVAQGGRRILSIGICGALCPELRVGDIVIASEIVTADAIYPADASWTRELTERVPSAIVASMAGVDRVSANSAQKAGLRASTNAKTVDLESHVAARAALMHGLPFAALRIVSDGAQRDLPHAAQVAMHPSGGVNLPAVLRSVARAPLQVLPLIRTAWEAEIAFSVLLRCCSVLHAGFARANLGELALDMT